MMSHHAFHCSTMAVLFCDKIGDASQPQKQEGIVGTNTYWCVAVTMEDLNVMRIDQAAAIWMRNKQMFGKLG